MGDHGVMDGTNIFLVVIIVIIVVTIAAALLAFICTQVLPDIDTSKFNPKSFMKRKQQNRPNSPSVVLPSKIVVTRPASDVGSLASDVGSQTDVQDYDYYDYDYDKPSPPPEIKQVQSSSSPPREEKERKPRRKLPRQRVIYSCEPSPTTSPSKRVFIWSRNNSYDLQDKENGSGKGIRGHSPLGVYNHFAARRNSAPMGLKPTKSVFF